MFDLFPFVGPGHPFFAQVEGFRARIAAEPRVPHLASGATTIHAEIKALPGAGGWRLDRFYWSLQRYGAVFQALTLSHAAKSGETGWYGFPEDAYLKTMAAYFAAPPEGLRVLRFVPLRRLTFRAVDAAGRPVIGKFKRASRFRQAYELLGRVADAVEAAAPGFRVSRPLAIDEARCLYFQSALPGADLADALAVDNCGPLLERVGGLLCDLHRMPAPAVPVAAAQAALDTLRRDVAWIGFMQPELAPWLGGTLAAMERAAPQVQGGDAVFCHGDFVCSQILMAGDGWSVTDFDLCHRGDPCRDLAILLASLPYDVPLLRHAAQRGRPEDEALLASAAAACIAGYAARAGADFDGRRLAWQRIAAEIYYLGLMLKKDQFSEAVAAHRLRTIRRLEAALGPVAALTP
jgi:aminoglycoside phosphotransferase (APT) family kinase protein